MICANLGAQPVEKRRVEQMRLLSMSRRDECGGGKDRERD
jgi:hypothetical protein